MNKDFKVGDKVVMSRDFRSFELIEKDSTAIEWWKEMEEAQPLTIKKIQLEMDGREVSGCLFFETKYTASKEWLLPYKE